ncbi:HAD-IC family P-type ATPase [Ligilactobacillus aviarius]|uniref:HAD-IC family P-type ATPase n=1 Tax=Ligilactobacillus aviarius TaxID=1606 RepID=UPI0024BB3DA3|nr:HAD-IC family P-type ATPase [Ligilactobacillus aviarius]
MLHGLSKSEVQKRQRKYGLNLVEGSHFNLFREIMSGLWGFSAWVLEFALIVEIILKEYTQVFFILLLLLFAAVNGALQQKRTQQLLAPLKKDLKIHVRVLRDDKWQIISADQLVPGDIISLKQGEILPADVTLISGKIGTDESSITGESAMILHDENSEVLSGVSVIYGAGIARVIRTGNDSRVGKTVNLTKEQKANDGKLQFLLGKIIHYLAIIDTVLVLILFTITIVRHQNIINILPLMALLFIATIPIAMPSSFSIANSVEANVLAKEKVLVNKLESIQNAANIDLLMLDKTGTLTDSTFELTKIHNFSVYEDDDILALAKSATNKISPSNLEKVFQRMKIRRNNLKILNFNPFDINKKYSNSNVIFNGKRLDVKLGSPINLMSSSDWFKYVKKLNNKVVAMTIDDELAALFEMTDHLRPDTYRVVQELQQRAIKMMVITGDNFVAAQGIAQKLKRKTVEVSELSTIQNIKDVSVICEVLPEDKLTILKFLKDKGYTVGMVGDGMNDAPALKAADVGIATSNAVDLAKQSAGIIMQKEGISSISDILDSGHRVYQRMMTWTITKLSRTAQLAILLTLGYWIANFVPVNLNAIVLIAILNDLVTMVLGTDNTNISHKPEKWNMQSLVKISLIFTTGWVLSGMLLFIWLFKSNVVPSKISTIMFLFLIFSAMLTILMTRTRGTFEKGKPSKAVLIIIGINCILVSGLAIFGKVVFPISWKLVLLVFGGTFGLAMLIDMVKVRYYSREKNM